MKPNARGNAGPTVGHFAREAHDGLGACWTKCPTAEPRIDRGSRSRYTHDEARPLRSSDWTFSWSPVLSVTS